MSTVGLCTTVFGNRPPGPQDWASISSHGFTEIELALAPRRQDAADRAALAALKETAAGAGVHLAALSVALADAESGIGSANELGCKLLVVRAGPCRLHPADPRESRSPGSSDPGAMRRIVEPLSAIAESRGVSLAIEFPSSWPAQEAVRLLEALDAPPVGVCLDLGHAHLQEGAPEAIEQLAGYVHTIHVNDNLGRADDHRLPFAGAIEWPAVLMELEKTGYTGPLVLELAGEPDTATAIARAVGARTRLQAILDDLAQPMVFPE